MLFVSCCSVCCCYLIPFLVTALPASAIGGTSYIELSCYYRANFYSSKPEQGTSRQAWCLYAERPNYRHRQVSRRGFVANKQNTVCWQHTLSMQLSKLACYSIKTSVIDPFRRVLAQVIMLLVTRHNHLFILRYKRRDRQVGSVIRWGKTFLRIR